MSHLSEFLNGAKLANIAKREKVTENAIYHRVVNEIINLNRKNGTNLSTHLSQVKKNRQAYRDLLVTPTNNKKTTTTSNTNTNTNPKKLYELLRFNDPLEAMNALEGDYRIGAIIMYNTLKNA